MSTNSFLQKQIDLLLESFGEEAILRALRRSPARAEQKDEKLSLRRLQPSLKKRQPSNDEVIMEVAAKNPEQARNVEKLGYMFQRGLFLRSAGEVNRFLSRYSHSTKRVESRAKALPQILSVVVSLSEAEVRHLIEVAETYNASSLGVIADAVLSRE